MLAIGLMSGTSMDGIDAALIETDGRQIIREIYNGTYDYDPEFKILLKAAELAVKQYDGELTTAKSFFQHALSNYLKEYLNVSDHMLAERLDTLSLYFHNDILPITFDQIVERSTTLHGHVVLDMLEKSNYAANTISVIGYHGQTLFHQPTNKISLQIGNGSLLAQLTEIPVVNDFRAQDIISGGQGAPLAPIYHHALTVRDQTYPAVVVNCGGIANITVISGPNENDILGFDTGPGNGLIDRYIKQKTSGKESMDTDGKYGNQGKINEVVVQQLYQKCVIVNGKNYFNMSTPKSLDINDLTLIPEIYSLSLPDACATLASFTADSIVKSIEWFRSPIPKRWFLTGGGWHNPVIRRELQKKLESKLDRVQIQTVDEAGWNSRAMEAQLFAYLAVRSLQNLPISFPNTTGVPKPLSGGQVFYP